MVNAKIIGLAIALLVAVTLIAGIAFIQFANAQANANSYGISQVPQQTYGANSNPHQGYYGSAQYGSSYGYGYGGMGTGMCGRFW